MTDTPDPDLAGQLDRLSRELDAARVALERARRPASAAPGAVPESRDIRKALGGAIRRRRKAMKLRLPDMQEATGMAHTTLARYETGELRLYADLLFPIAAFLETTPDALMREAMREFE